jgi:hypothetical protein
MASWAEHVVDGRRGGKHFRVRNHTLEHGLETARG